MEDMSTPVEHEHITFTLHQVPASMKSKNLKVTVNQAVRLVCSDIILLHFLSKLSSYVLLFSLPTPFQGLRAWAAAQARTSTLQFLAPEPQSAAVGQTRPCCGSFIVLQHLNNPHTNLTQKDSDCQLLGNKIVKSGQYRQLLWFFPRRAINYEWELKFWKIEQYTLDLASIQYGIPW